MCTAISLTSGDGFHFFGRNMDLEYDFNQQIITVPRNYPIKNNLTGRVGRSYYAITGMGTVAEEHPLLADGFNEMGLACAGLNFPKYAHYEPVPIKGRYNMAPYDFILWMLSSFASVAQLRREVENVCLVAHPFAPNYPLPALHWITYDKTGDSIVIEQEQDGLHVYDNPLGVLSNSPTFPWHMTNLNQYAGLSSHQPATAHWGRHSPAPDGQGLGLFGLPGDSYPASRFVRAAYLTSHARHIDTQNETLSTFFHILDNLAMPDGSVITPEGAVDITRYSAAICLETGVYYYKTHQNSQITAVKMSDGDIAGERLVTYPYPTEQHIFWAN